MLADRRRHVRHRTNSRGEAAESAANAELRKLSRAGPQRPTPNVEISMHHKRLMMSADSGASIGARAYYRRSATGSFFCNNFLRVRVFAVGRRRVFPYGPRSSLPVLERREGELKNRVK